jgi:hypothetical protein
MFRRIELLDEMSEEPYRKFIQGISLGEKLAFLGLIVTVVGVIIAAYFGYHL